MLRELEMRIQSTGYERYFHIFKIPKKILELDAGYVTN
jgi:hypothetical protein